MSTELEKMYEQTESLKNVLLENNNIDILLYLSKYNPDATRDAIARRFGKEALEGLEDLKQLHLIREKEQQLTLTNEGIFQVEGLLTLAL
ncbi:MAG: hypothetical protein J4203_03015 [Candidatus Diapherotrites archaeon]|uniref:Uncharacterized protein n=1 Tax=Candidatus Iainarchaeum sp. TaxID=3101447 RepID=A0A8T4L6B6_9ARCH|nr:hypothetical protein [Candidatus Diapherotrites archaeon]